MSNPLFFLGLGLVIIGMAMISCKTVTTIVIGSFAVISGAGLFVANCDLNNRIAK